MGQGQPRVFPTAPGARDDLEDSVGSIAQKLDPIPYDEIARSGSTPGSRSSVRS